MRRAWLPALGPSDGDTRLRISHAQQALLAEIAGLGVFTVAGDNRVERVRYAEPSGEMVGREVAEGHKARPLSFDDIAWRGRICAALAETPRVLERIAETIAARGGWPIRRVRREPR